MGVMMKTTRAGVLAVVSGVSLLAMTAPGAYAAGMPQLDFHNPLVTGQVIWGGVIFLVFTWCSAGSCCHVLAAC